MKTEMRLVVEELGKLGEFCKEDVVKRVKATPHGVEIYLSRLITLEVINNAHGSFRKGPAFQRWARKNPKTNPGGSSCEYKAARDKRDLENIANFQARIAANKNIVTEKNPLVPAKHWDKRFTAAFRKG